jgi:hypothetical protein
MPTRSRRRSAKLFEKHKSKKLNGYQKIAACVDKMIGNPTVQHPHTIVTIARASLRVTASESYTPTQQPGSDSVCRDSGAIHLTLPSLLFRNKGYQMFVVKRGIQLLRNRCDEQCEPFRSDSTSR